MSLWRLVAIGLAALSLASCRALPMADSAGARRLAGDASGSLPPRDPANAPRPSSAGPAEIVPVAWHESVGCAAAPGGCRDCRIGRTPDVGPGPLGSGPAVCRMPPGCGPDCCPVGAAPCPPLAVLPPPAVPVAEFCRICDGGDHGRPARPEAADGIRNLTAGDTVARWEAAGEFGDEPNGPQITVSNCACVCAPKFASVREILRPYEGIAPSGPVAVVRDDGPEVAARRQRIRARTQRIPPEMARRATPELALVETVPPMAAERPVMPADAVADRGPVERVSDDAPHLVALRRRPQVAIGFDVPLAWTCLAQAMVTISDTAAEVVSIEEGVATLRLRTPGRPELTLCKTAGSNTARSGEELDFTIALYNSGERTLERIALVDALPRRLDYVPDSADATLPFDFSTETGDDGSTVLKWVFREPLPPGESGFVRFRTLVR
jgi:uncharacterized repeat protein (TIGR01451 family)